MVSKCFKLFFIFTPILGEDEPILTHLFQMGWFNHQPVFVEGDFLWIGSYRIHHHERTTIWRLFFFPTIEETHPRGVFLCKPRKKTLTTFHYTGWLIGILTMVYYNPYIITGYNPLYNPTNQGIFHGLCGLALFLVECGCDYLNGAC